MSYAHQDPATASAPFDSRADGSTVRTLAQDQPFDSGAKDHVSRSVAQDEPREITVVAKRFSFEPARIEVTEGERVRLVVKSADGVHGLEIKRFNVARTVPRGEQGVTIDFTASAAGEFPILCSEYCGDGHDDMKGMLVVSARKAAGATVPAAAPGAAAAAPATPPATAPATAVQDDDPDRDQNNAQPDFYVATLPTTLRVPKGKMAFRLTHRFLRTLGDGDFGDLAARAFGFDSGAQIGIDLKYGLFRGGALGFYRTSDRTIQLSAQYNAIQQDGGPLGVGFVVNVDGTDNFSDEFSPGAMIVLSRELGDKGAIYFEPSVVSNSNIGTAAGDDYTVMAGVGARIRARRNTFLFVEASPRVAGFKPAVTLVSFGFEQRYGGHVFQLNFSNGFATTLAQVARGGTGRDDWYLGFNLSRKFY
jgi:cytochrome c oxidase subunit 2